MVLRELTLAAVLLRILVACLLGGIIGIEREILSSFLDTVTSLQLTPRHFVNNKIFTLLYIDTLYNLMYIYIRFSCHTACVS